MLRTWYLWGVVFYAMGVVVTFFKVKDAMMNDPEFQELALPYANPATPPNPAPIIIPAFVPVMHWILAFGLLYICLTPEGWDMLKKKLAEKSDDLKK